MQEEQNFNVKPNYIESSRPANTISHLVFKNVFEPWALRRANTYTPECVPHNRKRRVIAKHVLLSYSYPAKTAQRLKQEKELQTNLTHEHQCKNS